MKYLILFSLIFFVACANQPTQPEVGNETVYGAPVLKIEGLIDSADGMFFKIEIPNGYIWNGTIFVLIASGERWDIISNDRIHIENDSLYIMDQRYGQQFFTYFIRK